MSEGGRWDGAGVNGRPPHPATVAQPKAPHPATVIQAKRPHAALVASETRRTHAATMPQAERSHAHSSRRLGNTGGQGAAQRMEGPSTSTSTAQSEKKQYVLKVALMAFEHMRRLVVSNHKDGEKGPLSYEDIEAAKIYRAIYRGALQKDDQRPLLRNVGAFAVNGQYYYFATNASVPKEAKERNKSKFGDRCRYVDEVEPKDNDPIQHAEMKVYSATGGAAYIGVSKLCCLYCAAQLLAKGFSGFRGCSMVAFNHYGWLPEVETNSNYRRALWGEEVEKSLRNMDLEMWQQFLKTMSNGATLLQKYREVWGKEHIYPLKEYAKSNQYPYDTTEYDSDNESMV